MEPVVQYDLNGAIQQILDERKRLQDRIRKIDDFISLAREMQEMQSRELPVREKRDRGEEAVASSSLTDVVQGVLETQGKAMRAAEILGLLNRKGVKVARSSVTSALMRNQSIKRIRRGLYGLRREVAEA